MRKWLKCLSMMAALCGSGPAPSQGLAARTASAAPGAASGIDFAAIDTGVRPQDDFYRYAVGSWIARVRGPSYMPGWSASRDLQLHVYEALDGDMRRLSRSSEGDADTRKLVDLYTSYMNVGRIDAVGLRPLAGYFRTFDASATPDDVIRAIAMLSAQGLDIGVGTWIHPDDRDPGRYVADFVQSDLGLPDRDYYTSSDARFSTIRKAYRLHVARLLALSGTKDADRMANDIVQLEKKLAAAQWSEAAKRVPGATSHRTDRVGLSTTAPGLNLALFADGIGVPRTFDRFNLGQPDYFAAFGSALRDVPVSVWRGYLRYRLLDHLARFLPRPYRAEADGFWTLKVAGATGVRPRWLRAMGMIEDAMGDAMGQLYVRYHFSPQTKTRASAILGTVVTAFRRRIEASDWMHAASKQGALAKLDHLVIRMGAPDRIRDYTRLRTDPADAVGNWMRARTLLARLDIDKLDRPVDREEWTMSPQSVNGYYSVSKNQVVLPAALLQPPYFRPGADDAVNYGGLGYFIAHELTHAFDRAGSQYDGLGKRIEWMTPEDRAEFERRAGALIAQYGDYQVAPGYRLNGALTIGENIADNSGLAVALDAYRIALGGNRAPVLDGLTGDQRFYLGFARIWASQPIVTPQAVTSALADTHAPDHLRVLGALANQDAFYAAFNVRPGDGMYRPPAARARIW